MRVAQRRQGAAIPLSAPLLAAMIAGFSSALAQGGSIQEKSFQEIFASYGGVPAHPQSGWHVRQSAVARQPVLDCELREPESDIVDADLWVRLKLKYQWHCYKQAEGLIHRRLQQLSAINPSRPVKATGNNTRLRNLNTLKFLAGAIADASTASSSAGVDEAVPASNMFSATPAGKAAETIPSEVASNSVEDAKFYLEMGIASYRDGDLAAAIADFDLAIEFDPNLKDAYINQGVAWYRVGSFNRAFAVIAEVVRIENSH